MRRRIGIVGILCGVLFAQEPPAADARAAAQRHVERAEALFKEEKFAAAREEFEKARDLLGGAGDPGSVLTLRGRVADCCAAEGDFDRAAQTWRGGGDHPDVASGLHSVASCLNSLGRADEALPLYQETIAMRRRLFEGDHPDVARALNNVAGCLLSLGRPGEALPLFEESLAMRRRLFRGDHPDVARLLNNVAGCLLSLGRPGGALPLFEESLAMWRRLFEGDHPEVARGLNNVAGCLDELGRSGEALPLYEDSLAMLRRLFEGDHPEVARGLNCVASCLRSLGRAGEALPLAERSLAMYRHLFKGDHPHVAWCLSSVASYLDALGRPAEALPLYEDSLAMYRRLFRGDHPDVARGLCNVAGCMDSLGRPAAALPFYEESVAMSRRLENPERHFMLANFGVCLSRLGRGGEAVAVLEEAVEQIESLRSEARGLTEEDRGAYFGKLKEFNAYGVLIRALRALGRDGEALTYLEQARARSLLDTLDRGRFDAWAEARRQAAERQDPELLDRIGKVQSALDAADADVGRLTYSLARMGPTGTDTPERQEAARKLTTELAAARRGQQATLRQRAQLIRGEFAVTRPADAAALQRLAGREGRVLEYAVSNKEATLFDVPPPGSPIRAFPLLWADGTAVTGESLAAKVDAYVALMRSGKGDARGLDRVEEGGGGGTPGRDLFEALVPAPVREVVLKARVVYVVADGALNRLPFETLMASPGTFWLDAGPPLVYGASGSALLWNREQRDRQLSEGRLGEAVIVGDPVFKPAAEHPAAPAELSRYGELRPLPGTRREAEAIAEALKGMRVTPLLGTAATHPAVLAAAPRARYLHFATHGLADETETASYSSLALAAPAMPTGDDDGFLSLADLLSSRWRGKLRMCELVVLSACETQKGRLQKDEAVQALPVGFLYAGASAVIATLWPVDDASAPDLMGDFYRRLAAGNGKLEAFTEARKALRKAHPEPRHWAPFVYIGDPR